MRSVQCKAFKGSHVNKRLLYASSTRRDGFENQDPLAHYKDAPYSIEAIGYNLSKLGWKVCWCGWAATHNPFRLAKEIDAFEPDVVYSHGSLLALHPLFCRKFLCRHKAFKLKGVSRLSIRVTRRSGSERRTSVLRWRSFPGTSSFI